MDTSPRENIKNPGTIFWRTKVTDGFARSSSTAKSTRKVRICTDFFRHGLENLSKHELHRQCLVIIICRSSIRASFSEFWRFCCDHHLQVINLLHYQNFAVFVVVALGERHRLDHRSASFSEFWRICCCRCHDSTRNSVITYL